MPEHASEPRLPWAPAGTAGLITALLVLGGLAANPSRPLAMLSLLALVSAMGWLGWRGAGALLGVAPPGSRIVCAFTVAVASVTASTTFLGHFGQLRSRPFLVVEALLFVLSLSLPRVPLPASRTPAARLKLWSTAGCQRALLAAAATALALRFGGSVLHVMSDPDAFLAYDDLSYHLSTVATWHHAGDLRMIKFEIGDPSTTFYPFVGELCSWALLAPLRDCDVLARRVQLPFALCSLFAVAAISGRLGLSRRSSLFAALLYASFDRAFPNLALGAGNDHATAFFTLAGVDGSLAFLGRPGRRTAAYIGLALGLLAGTKYIGLLFAAAVLALLTVHGLITIREAGFTEGDASGAHRPSMLQACSTVAALMIAFGGYAYIRNAWTAGNPVFPAPISLFGHRLLAGWSTATLAWRRHQPEFHIDTVSFLIRRPDLFGPLFPWTMLPAALLVPVVAFWKRHAGHTAVLVLPVVLFLEFRFLIHDHRDVRYILAAVALAAVATAWLLAAVPLVIGRLLTMAVLGGILFSAVERFHVQGAPEAVLLSLFVAGGALISTAAGRLHGKGAHTPAIGPPALRRTVTLTGLLGAAAIAAWAGSRLIDTFQGSKLAKDRAPLVLERAASRAGVPVAYVGSNEPYLFFGTRLQNDVRIVPTDGDLAAQYYTWGGSVHFPFDGGSPGQWRSNLIAQGVHFIVAVRTRAEGPERRWMAAGPQEFKPVYQDAETEIWRFDPPRRRGES